MTPATAAFLRELADLMERHKARMAHSTEGIDLDVAGSFHCLPYLVDSVALRAEIPGPLRYEPTAWKALRHPGGSWHVGRRLVDGTIVVLRRDTGVARRFTEAAARAEAARLNEPSRLTRDQIEAFVHAHVLSEDGTVAYFLQQQGYTREAPLSSKWRRDDHVIDLDEHR